MLAKVGDEAHPFLAIGQRGRKDAIRAPRHADLRVEAVVSGAPRLVRNRGGGRAHLKGDAAAVNVPDFAARGDLLAVGDADDAERGLWHRRAGEGERRGDARPLPYSASSFPGYTAAHGPGESRTLPGAAW